MGVAVSGMHYTGMAAMRVHAAASGDGMLMTGGGATAENFLLPLVIGISVLAFILTATLALSPTDQEMRAEAELLDRIEQASASYTQAVPAALPTAQMPGQRREPRRPGPPPGRTGRAPRVTLLAARGQPDTISRVQRPRARPDRGWLLLVYRVPSEPSRLRATVWRRIKSLGAIYLQSSAAALPASVAAERALRKLRSEITRHVRHRRPAVVLSAGG